MPFWAIRHSHELKDISLSEEMRQWSTGRDYDKPIARRILEQSGVPHGCFGMLKKNCSHETSFLWPHSPDARERFGDFIRSRGFYTPSGPALSVLRRIASAENLLHLNLLGRIGLQNRLRPWERLIGPRLIFHWANDELKQRYQEGLREMNDLAPLPIGAAIR